MERSYTASTVRLGTDHFMPIGVNTINNAMGPHVSFSFESVTNTLSHAATCVTSYRMNGTGTVVAVAGDQQISVYFDSALALASQTAAQGDRFSGADQNYANGQYITTTTLIGLSGSITCIALEGISTDRDAALGVVGLTNGKVVPFVVIGPGNRAYNAAHSSRSNGADVQGLLKPLVELLPPLDLSAATSHSVSIDEPTISVAIGLDATRRVEFIAAATSTCAILFSCTSLFSSANTEGVLNMLFGAVSETEEDDNIRSSSIKRQECLRQLSSMFTYKGFNVYQSAKILKICSLSSVVGYSHKQLRRIFPSASSSIEAIESSPVDRLRSPVALTYGGSSSAVTATVKGSSLEIVASAVLTVVLEDGSLRFIGRCVDARSWGGLSNKGGASQLPASASMAPLRARSYGEGVDPKLGGFGSTLAHTSHLYQVPLSAKDPEYQYISLNDVVRLRPQGNNNVALTSNNISLGDNSSLAAAPVALTRATSGNYTLGSGNQWAALLGAAASGQTENQLNDADLFYNPVTGLVDSVAVGADLARNLFSGGSMDLASPSGGTLSSEFSGDFMSPNKVASSVPQSLGYITVARSVVHGSVFHPSSRSAVVVDVDVILPTASEGVVTKAAHFHRVGHAKATQRGLSVVRVISAPSQPSMCPQASLVASGNELFLTFTTARAADANALNASTQLVVASPTNVTSSPHNIISRNAHQAGTGLLLLCSFGGPILDINVLSVTPVDQHCAEEIAQPAATQQRFAIIAVVGLGKRAHVVKCII